MTIPNANLEVQRLHDSIVVHFTNQPLHDSSTFQSVKKILLDLAEEEKRELILDFTRVQTLSSRMLSNLISLNKKLDARGERLTLRNLNLSMKEFLAATKLQEFFHTVEEDAGLATTPTPSPSLVSPEFHEFTVALGDPHQERAGRIIEVLASTLKVAYFTDIDAFDQHCRKQASLAVVMPFQWSTAMPAADPQTDSPVLRLIRLHGRHTPIFIYAATDLLPLEEYCRALAAGARKVFNEASPSFVLDLRDSLTRLLDDRQALGKQKDDFLTLFAQHGLIGQSSASQEVFRRAARASLFSDLPVLILGETGTGKQRLAEAIHRLDPTRCARPFVTINCSAISKTLAESELFGHTKGAFTGAQADRPGLFRSTHGGTLLLDEVGELDLELQPKLLRVIQERRLLPVGSDYEHSVDIRIIAATNRPMEKLIAEGKFRADLYQRLNVFRISIPPLRERPEDIEVQAHYFLKILQRQVDPLVTEFSARVLEALRRLSWEGNTRQLENLIREVLAHKEGSGLLQMEDLPRWALESLAQLPSPQVCEHPVDGLLQKAYVQKLTLNEAMEEFEHRFLKAALARNDGNRTRTAAELGMTARSIFNKIKKYGLE